MKIHRGWGRRVAVALLTLACAGCAARRVSGPDLLAQCLVHLADRGAADSVTVGVTAAVDFGHVPVPTNEAEALVFRHLFEPPVRMDCRGRAVAGFATAWWHDAGGTVWRYALRPDLRFSDGTPVSAADVVALWRDARPDIASLRVLGDTAVETTFTSRTDIATGADPALAVWKTSGAGTPMGTVARTVTREMMDGRPVVTLSGGNGPVLRFVIGPGDDPRDLLDLGVDAVITADRATLRYAEAHEDLTVVPLRWTRTYALIAGSWQASLADRRDELARDVVPVDARRAEGAGALPWREGACVEDGQTAPPARAPAVRRVVYAHDDAVARALAERLVALTQAGNVFAEAVSRAELASATAQPSGFAYVVSLTDLSVTCETLRRYGKLVLPLIDVRSSLIARHGVGPVWVGADGLPRFDGRP